LTDALLAFGAALSAATCVLYGYVGFLMLARPVSPEASLANKAFAAWWFSLGGMTLLDGARRAIAAVGISDLAIHVAFVNASILALVFALASITYYLLYLYTGRRGVWIPVVAGHAVIYVYLLYLVVFLDPVALDQRTIAVNLEYATPASGGVLWIALALILGPVLFAAIAYGSLYRRVESPLQKYRVALVSSAFIVWFGAAPILGFATGWSSTDWWPIVSAVLGLAIPMLIILAYRPPAWVRSRLGVVSGHA